MALRRDLAVDELRDPDIRAAYEEGRLAYVQGMGTLHCPHCSKGVGVLLPGNALGRTAASRTLFSVVPAKSIDAAKRDGSVVVVVPKSGTSAGKPLSLCNAKELKAHKEEMAEWRRAGKI